MRRHLSHISIPFPVGLMSSNRNATHMPDAFAREIRNMLTSLSGAGTKRNGFSYKGALPDTETVRQLTPFMAAHVEQILAFCDSGNIYLSEDGGSSWVQIPFTVTPHTHIRWVHFARKLILCNGVDDICSWDGVRMSSVVQWIEDRSETFTRISNTRFSLIGIAEDYTVGGQLKCTLKSGVDVTVTLTHKTQDGETVILTVEEALLTETITGVLRAEKPPKFNMIYAAHDRLWGMGSGEISAQPSTGSAERSFVFYTYGVDDETAWRDDVGALQYIDLSGKISVLDEVLAMSVKDNFTLFFMRNHIQIWSGYNPTALGDMSWQKTVPLGIAHGDLVMSLPNDIAFFTQYGVRTLSRMLQTEQLDVNDIGSELDPTLADALRSLENDAQNYKHSVSTFLNAKQGWYGFFVGDETYVFQLGQIRPGWSIFDGLFSDLTGSCNLSNGYILMAANEKIYIYDHTVFADDGAPIITRWWTPWLNVNKEGRWANKYTEVIAEQGAPIDISLMRYKNYNSASYIASSVQVRKQPDHFDEAIWDEAFFDYVAGEPTSVRDSYVADTFSYSIETETTEGPLTLYGLKLHGIREK